MLGSSESISLSEKLLNIVRSSDLRNLSEKENYLKARCVNLVLSVLKVVVGTIKRALYDRYSSDIRWMRINTVSLKAKTKYFLSKEVGSQLLVLNSLRFH